MHACMDAGGRAASGTSGRGGRAASGTAAEVVPIPLLWRGARQGGVVEPRLPAAGRSGTKAEESTCLLQAGWFIQDIPA